MGYVLPIENYQYQNYQSRVNKTNRDPYPIEQLYPAQLDMSYHNQGKAHQRNDHQPTSTRKLLLASRVQQKQPQSLIEKIHADITGKGRYLNEIV